MSKEQVTKQREEWRAVVGYEGKYEVSNFGRVRSIGRTVVVVHRTGQFIRPLEGKLITTCKSRVALDRGTLSLRRVVFEAFIGLIPEGHHVIPKDGDVDNCRPENLQAITPNANRLGRSKYPPKLQGDPIGCKEVFRKETWRPVVGGEGDYEVSSSGNVRRARKMHYWEAGGLLTAKITNGYRRVGLALNGSKKRVSCKVACLVASAFIGDRPKGWHINHIDANKQNDNVSNLEYVTPSYNTQHAFRLGLMTGSFKNGHAYLPRRAS